MRMMHLVPSVFCLSLVIPGVADSSIQHELESAADEVTLTLPGEVPLVLVRIPAGTFVMGSPEDERGYLERDGPLTTVTLSEDFYMGKYPVTQAQWAAVMGEEWPNLGFPGQPNNPVESVSWNDAQDFIASLNAHNSSTGQGWVVVRLPTEAEWEYAARAGTTTRFYFGDSLIDVGGATPTAIGARTMACARHTCGIAGTMVPTARNRIGAPNPWARSCPTRSGFTTCTATSGSGARIGTLAICPEAV